jgi:large subunit ribosomal protein L5
MPEVIEPKLKTLYNEKVISNLVEQFGYKNIHEVPKLEKIQINRCLGLSAQNPNLLNTSIEEFRLITGQQPVVTKARKSIAGFKLREGIPLGLTVTLRNKQMYYFLERFINLTLPRIRDFQGLNAFSFDKHGNYNMGLKDQLIFPELEYDKVNQLLGFNISVVTTAKTKEESLALLKELTLPMQK